MTGKKLQMNKDQALTGKELSTFDVDIFPNDNNNAVLSVQTNDKRLFLLYRRIAQYNKGLTKANTEEVSVILNDHMIVGTITAFKGQAGIVFVWDLDKNRIIHVSDGSYAVRVTLFNNIVYSLHFVSSWGKKAEFQLRCTDFGTKDPNKAPSIIPVPEAVSSHSWSDNIELKVVKNKLVLEIGEDSYAVN